MRSIDNNLLARYVVTVVTPFTEAVNIGEKGGSWSSVLYQKVLIIPPTSLINTNTKHFNLVIFLNASFVQTNHGLQTSNLTSRPRNGYVAKSEFD